MPIIMEMTFLYVSELMKCIILVNSSLLAGELLASLSVPRDLHCILIFITLLAATLKYCFLAEVFKVKPKL